MTGISTASVAWRKNFRVGEWCADPRHFDDLDSEGYIAIQHHGEKGQVYRFRNLRIKELK